MKPLFLCALLICSVPVAALDEAASQRYTVLMESVDTISAQNTFWQLAIAFGSLYYYAKVAGLDTNVVVTKAISIFEQKTKGITWWYDDYGWWAEIFLLFAEDAKGDLRDILISYAEQCYRIVNENASQLFNRASRSIQAEQTPYFENGVYNNPLVERGQDDGLQGIQNTVTNGLFLFAGSSLATHYYELYLRTYDFKYLLLANEYLKTTQTQWLWFQNWFADGLRNDTISTHHLIEERIAFYKDDVRAIGYEADRIWSGDQGVMIMALNSVSALSKLIKESLDLSANAEPLDDDGSGSLADSIRLGVQEVLVDQNGLLIPTYKKFYDQFPWGDNADYDNGPGIYVRLLAGSGRFVLSSSEINLIEKNAQHIVPIPVIAPITQVYEFNQEQSNLAILTAAIANANNKNQTLISKMKESIHFDNLWNYLCCCGSNNNW